MTILITNGNRPRNTLSSQNSKSLFKAAIPRGRTFKDQEELQDFWLTQIGDVPKEHYVDAVADSGIFSEALRPQVEQITTNNKTYGFSMGLGYVRFDRKYPNFSFGEYEGDLSAAVEGTFNAKTWWRFLAQIGKVSLKDIVLEGIKAKETVIFTVPALVYHVVQGELADLAGDTAVDVNELVKYFRLIGPDLDARVPPSLLDCVMPYESDHIDRVVPGTASTRSRRVAYLLTRIAQNSDSPIDDFRKVLDYTHDEKSPVLQFKSVDSRPKSKTQKLDTAELRKLVAERYRDRCHGMPLRITRMMRHDGYNVTQEEVEAVLSAPPTKKPSTKPTQKAGAVSKTKVKSKAQKTEAV